MTGFTVASFGYKVSIGQRAGEIEANNLIAEDVFHAPHPLDSHQGILNFIRSTKTEPGLAIAARPPRHPAFI